MFKHFRFSLIWFPMPPKKAHIPTTTKKRCNLHYTVSHLTYTLYRGRPIPILFTQTDPYPYSLHIPTHTHTLSRGRPILFPEADPYSFQRPTYTYTLYRDWSILFRGRSLFTEADPYSLQTPKYELPYMKRMTHNRWLFSVKVKATQ